VPIHATITRKRVKTNGSTVTLRSPSVAPLTPLGAPSHQKMQWATPFLDQPAVQRGMENLEATRKDPSRRLETETIRLVLMARMIARAPLRLAVTLVSPTDDQAPLGLTLAQVMQAASAIYIGARDHPRDM